MEIQIKSARRIQGLKKELIARKMEKALKDLGCNDSELSILITGDEEIHKLNMGYLKRDKPTNVLSFPMNAGDQVVNTGMLGDIVISADTAKREAFEMGITLRERACELLVHGLLHLMGYDHEISEKEEKRMQREEKRLLAVIMEE
ncbi:MAG: rRNA maturation RNase YbeY [Deltaproteobacteria bacterium]|nr:rRNA maturation RNase YbeY [Deltaproteobacteria bacterium]